LKKTIILFKDAAALIKVVASAKFDESVDIAVRWVIQEKRIKW
jgi:ribosomal protein L1